MIISPTNIKCFDHLYKAMQLSRPNRISRWGLSWMRNHFPCPQCQQVFTSVHEFTADIQRHLEQQKVALGELDQREHQCQKCGIMYSVIHDLMGHIFAKHPELFVCQICDQQFNDYTSLFRHIKDHFENKNKTKKIPKVLPFMKTSDDTKCLHCEENISYNSFQTLLHCYNEHKFYWSMCSICGKLLDLMKPRLSIRHFHSHDLRDLTHPKLRVMKLTLTTFNIRSITPLYEALHDEENDTEMKQWLVSIFICTYCHMSFNHQYLLVTHVQSHLVNEQTMLASLPEGKFECQHCGTIFSTNYKLGTHLATDHKAGIPCKICGKLFGFEMHLYHHERNMHGRLHQCSTCGKTFKQSAHLTGHARVHSNVKPFSCEVCGQQFKMQKTLSYHTKSFHDPDIIKDHQCDVCGKRFLIAASLQYHKISHSDVYSYECRTCGKMFKRSSGLRRHHKNHHVMSYARNDIQVDMTEQCDDATEESEQVVMLENEFQSAYQIIQL